MVFLSGQAGEAQQLHQPVPTGTSAGLDLQRDFKFQCDLMRRLGFGSKVQQILMFAIVLLRCLRWESHRWT